MKNAFDFEDLLACGRGDMFGPGNAQLPLPPMLMFDRITHIDNDGGAHGKMFCGAGDNVLLLTEYVRDRGVVTIEQAIHVQTGKIAGFFGLLERGLIEEGKVADLVVFNQTNVACFC